MNLRNIGDYSIGLDLGTGSVGWAVIDENGDLARFKGRPAWGSRLFATAETAASARMPRGQRRRYIRRRWRLNLLQDLFAEDMNAADPDFFIRLRQSSLWPDDRPQSCGGYHHPFFNGSDFNEIDYYNKFPTIFHLRQHLIETEDKADLRLIYLALHNIVKKRGNFLQEDNKNLSAHNADMKESVKILGDVLKDWCSEKGLSCEFNAFEVAELLESGARSKDIKSGLVPLFGLASSAESDLQSKAVADVLSSSFLGYKTDFAKIFPESGTEGSSFYLSNDEAAELYLESCPDDGVVLFNAIRGVYSAYVLMGILEEKGLSLSKIAAYNRYGEDLRTLKCLVKQYVPSEYNSFFRGALYEDGSDYDAASAQGYTRYNLGPSKMGSGGKLMDYATFAKAVEKLFANTDALSDDRYQDMMSRFEEEKFLRRLRTSDNGRIPYQLNLEEMVAIVENQGKHYPFLLEKQTEITSLVSFRIPYYVGPLTLKGARKDASGAARFAWSIRREGEEDSVITPWNWDQVIDKHASARAFIERMTGMCTYLHDEPVLPKCSLLYEEFCALNELNGSQWTQDGDKFNRFDRDDRMALMDDLFRKRRVTYKQVAEWLEKHGRSRAHVKGGQGVSGYESKCSSYIFFTKDVFKVDKLDESLIPMVEQIILWNTLFEDRSILKDEITRTYGDKLTEEQIKTICKKRFTGWGRLSKRLLTGLPAEINGANYTVMDVLREGDPVKGRAMVLQEILHDDTLKMEELIEEFNAQALGKKGTLDVNDLPGSPALRRSVNQALRIVDEIVSITKKQPTNIFVEVTREDDLKTRGKRTATRYKNIEEALKALKADGVDTLREFKTIDKDELDKRMSLYFIQNGKSLYSGKPLNLSCLSDYQIDHIIPQSYIKDDSFENLALVFSHENQNKADNLLIPQDVRRKMKDYWTSLFDAKLIGEKKYNNLMRSSISEAKMKGFIARQLVETSQSVKILQTMLSSQYPDTRIQPIKAELSSQLKNACGFAKCREINNFHHAHDAYRACQVGRFVLKRHPAMFDNPIGMTKLIRAYVREQGEELRKTGRISALSNQAGFLIQSFMRSGFDAETGEIFRDDWNAPAEVARMRKCLDYRDCYISRMPVEDAGAFWNATIYSPKQKKIKMGLPLKQDLDASKYGSYTSEQFAYFFVYKAYNPKKKVYCFEFEGAPIRVASEVSCDEGALARYAESKALEKKLEFVEIARKKVCKYQLIELDGGRFYLTALKGMRNATELAFSQEETKWFYELRDGVDDFSAEDRLALLDSILRKYALYAKKLGKQLDCEKIREAFIVSEGEGQIKTLFALLNIANAVVDRIDLTCLCLGKALGNMQPSFSIILSNPESTFTFIDQSPTGMFERRQKLEL